MTDPEHIQANTRPGAGGQDDVMAEHGSMVAGTISRAGV